MSFKKNGRTSYTLFPNRWSVALSLAGSLAGGCASNPTEEGAGDVCASASELLSECLGDAAIQLPADCDADAAEQILTQECSALSDPGKADFLSDVFCRAGVLSQCEGPVCESSATFPELSTECTDFTAVSDCGSCDYYPCRDAERDVSCGEEGYFLGFGHKYCERFTQVTFDRLSTDGKRWLDETRVCLQETVDEIAADTDLDCDEVQQRAIDAHPPCYLDSGVCDLPLTDQAKIATTVDVRDVDLRTTLVVGVDCLRDLFNADTGDWRSEVYRLARAPAPSASALATR